MKQNCTVLLAGHLGRPGGVEKPELSSKPVAEWCRNKINEINENNKINKEVAGICLKGSLCGFLVTEKLIVLENLRFDPREEANPSTGSGQVDEYAKELASLAEVYVNEAFADSERAHASMVGVPKFLPHYAGFRLAKEIEVLSGVLGNPKRPLLVIIGGAKIETKQPLIDKMKGFADSVIVGGKLLEKNYELRIKNYANTQFLELTDGAKDVTLNSLFMIRNSILTASTIVWNGPMGEIETGHTAGTQKLIDLIRAQKDAYKIVGGGVTVGFLDKLRLTDKFNWVCSGGGSMLKFLSGEKLPGIEALMAGS